MSNNTPSSLGMTRRRFIYTTLATGATVVTGPIWAASPRTLSPSDKLNIGCVGVGGKGSSDTQWCSSENIVALCDVSENALDRQKERYPNAKIYKDYREMLEKEKSLDAIDVATPDHMHAVIASMAIKMGKHVYCQKPLTHDVHEARTLRDLAKKHKVATQMGNQGSASDGLRRAVEVIQSGIIGPVRKAHVWTNRPIWPQGLDRPTGSDPVPAGFDWDLWLGTAPMRPFKETWPNEQAGGGRRGRNGVYQPFSWRGWQDFGTGALGDMACHTVNWPFRALNLGYPTEIEAQSSGMNKEMYPKNSQIRFEFPKREGNPALTFHWYDGGSLPPKDLTTDIVALLDKVSTSGCLLIGDKGQAFSSEDGDQDFRFFVKLNDEKELKRATDHEAIKAISEKLPRNAHKGSPDQRQHLEWIAACKGGTPGYSNFDIAAYLTEIILLGCVALRTGKKLEWDGPGMKAKNAPESAHFVKREYRKGWSL